MSNIKPEKFSSYLLASEVEIANEVSRRLIINGSIIINIFFISQLLLLSGASTYTLIYSTITTLISLALAIFLIRKGGKIFYILLNSITLAVMPIYIDQYVTKPWISYGLIIVILTLIAAGIDVRSIYVAILVMAVIVQYAIAKLNLNGISDNQDILLLNSYFSTLWVLIAGIGVYLARILYLKYCNQIDEQLFDLQDKFYEQSRITSEINTKDNKNLALHGTVLNTLISYNQIEDSTFPTKKLLEDLDKDISNIEASDNLEFSNLPMLPWLQTNLDTYNLKVKYVIDPNLVIDNKYLNSILEILREILLNTKKHTSSTNLSVFVKDTNDIISLTVEEILPVAPTYSGMENKLLQAKASKSLNRLTNSIGINIDITSSPDRGKLIYNLVFEKENSGVNVLQNIASIRKLSLSKNVELLTKVSLFYSVLAIIGFFIVNVPIYILITLSISVLLLGVELFSKTKSNWRPIISQILLLTLIPYVILNTTECSNLLYTPWLFNAIFGFVLYGISVLKNPILKWLPAVIFIAENILTKFTFPQQCQNLLDGSTPGFIFILGFGYLMAKVRGRNTQLDSELANSVDIQLEQSKTVANKIEIERMKIIADLKIFIKKYSNSQVQTTQVKAAISLLIQKIRVFLICSEFYSSSFIQEIHKFANERIAAGSSIKISIYATQLSEQYSFDFNQLQELDLKTRKEQVELVISDTDRLTLLYLVNNDEIAQFNITS